LTDNLKLAYKGTMKRNSASLFSAALMLCFAPLARAQADLPTVIVAPFSGDRVAIQYWQPALGSGLAEMLVTELGKMNKFTVLETLQLEVLKDEIREGQDGWIDASEKVEKGGFAAADFMFTGKVTQFGYKEQSVGLGGFVPRSLGNLGVRQSTANVRIDWRLVDSATRKILKTGSAAAEQKGTSFNVGVNIKGSGGGIGFNNKEFMDSALGKATVTALGQITSELQPFPLPESGRKKQKSAAAGQAAAAVEALKLTPGKVLFVQSSSAIIISLGKKQGFKDGDKLNLYEVTEVKDDKGEVVFADEKLVGELTIQAAQEERSRAAYTGNLTVKAGWVVKAK
jgi:curli biogenesis system outer membrane secretion channel CsgG